MTTKLTLTIDDKVSSQLKNMHKNKVKVCLTWSKII